MLSEKKILNETKNHYTPLQVKWSVAKLLLSESAVRCLLRVMSVSLTSRPKGCIKFVPHSCLVSHSHKVGVFLELAIYYFIDAKFAVMLRLSISWKSITKTCFYLLVQYTRKCINFTYLSHKPITLCVIYSKWKTNIIRNQSQRSRDHIKEKVASWPLKPSRTTA